MIEIIRTGMRCLLGSKLRAFLTIAGIAVGVASVVAVSSIGEIGKNTINSELTGMGMDSLVVSVQSGAAVKLTETELEDIKNLDGIGNAMPLMSVMTSGKLRGSSSTYMVWGVNEDADSVIDLEVLHGRLIGKGDISQKNRVCVIDEAIAAEMYKRTNIVGKSMTLTIGGIDTDFEIVGIVKNGVNTLQNMLGGFIPDFVYIPYSVMAEQSGRSGFDQITVKLDDNSQSEYAAAMVKKTLSEGSAENSYSVDNLLSQKEKMNNILSAAATALSAVAGVSLIVAGISIMTVMLVSVSERTREIGIKKSIGAGRGSIMAEFLIESAIITFIGSVIGITAGIAVSLMIGAAVGDIAVNWRICFAVLPVSVIIGGGFGVYPAFRAAALKPVDALRYE